MRKILLVDLAREYGGAEKVVEGLIRGFSNENLIDIFLVCLENTKLSEFAKNNMKPNEYMLVENDKRKIFSIIYNICKFVKKNNINIIHAHNIASEIVCVLVNQICGRKLITTIHSDCNYDFTKSIKSNIYYILENKLFCFNKGYITVSNQLKVQLIERGLDSRKIININNGIDEVKKENINIINDEFTICSIGRLVRVKAHIKLIKAISILKDKGIFIKCIIAGEGDLKEELINKVTEEGLTDRIEFLGFINDVKEVFNKSDCLIIQSEMEGLPIVVLEAMSYGIPIIANRVGGIAEALTSNLCIEMLNNNPREIARAIEMAKVNRKSLENIAISAKIKFKEKYSSNQFIKKHTEFYLNDIEI